MSFEPGTFFDNRYRIIKLIGSGAIGSVYLALEERLNRNIALKIIHSLHLSDPKNDTFQRFTREAQALSKLNCPNIVEIYRYGFTNENCPFLAMEYVEGISLRELLDKNKNLTYQETIEIAKSIAKGLEHAHKAGILHRDLKPENIIVLKETEKLSAKILDFGLCKDTLDTNNSSNSTKQQKLTQTGFVLGTPAYMSPEQCLGKAIAQTTDIYSFGCIVFEMLTGFPPYISDSFANLLFYHIQNEFPSLDRFTNNQTIAPELNNLIKKCTKKDTQERYQSFSEIIEELKNLSDSGNNIKIDYNEIKAVLQSNPQNLIPSHSNTVKNRISTILILLFFSVAILIPLAYYNLTNNQLFSHFLAFFPEESQKQIIYTSIKRLCDLKKYDEAAKIVLTLCQENSLSLLTDTYKRDLIYYTFDLTKNKANSKYVTKLAYTYLELSMDEFRDNVIHLKYLKETTFKQTSLICLFLIENCQDSDTWSKINKMLNQRIHRQDESTTIFWGTAMELPELQTLRSRSFFYQTKKLNRDRAKLAILTSLESITSCLNHNLFKIAEDDCYRVLDLCKKYSFIPLEVRAHSLLGIIYYQKNEKEKAMAEYKECLAYKNWDSVRLDRYVQRDAARLSILLKQAIIYPDQAQ